MGDIKKDMLLSRVTALIFVGVVMAVLAYIVMYNIVEGIDDGKNRGNYLKRYEDGKM